MLASIPASMVNQKLADLGIPHRFNLNQSRFRSGFCEAGERFRNQYAGFAKLPRGLIAYDRAESSSFRLGVHGRYAGPRVRSIV